MSRGKETAVQRTLFDKVWTSRVVSRLPDGRDLLHVDRHILHELTSPQAFDRLAAAGRRVRNPELTFATQDHIIATVPGRDDASWAEFEALVQGYAFEDAHERLQRALEISAGRH